MKRIEVAELLSNEDKYIDQPVKLSGWVKAFRNNQFIALSDGTTMKTIQVVVNNESIDESLIKRIGFHACIQIMGTVKKSLGKGQSIEIVADNVLILGDNDLGTYPLQPKRQTLEFLREQAHFRMRTNTMSAVFRIRHAMAFAVHNYFNSNGYHYLHSPIITGSDAEGAGEMFRVTTLDAKQPPLTDDGKVDFSEDFFGKATNLTVSGQLQAEIGALALGKVYTFGPTFRAENSNTTRHLSEFWMIEPEMAFFDIHDNMDLAENFLQSIIKYVLENCKDELEVLDARIIETEKNMKKELRRPMGLIESLEFVTSHEFERITYTEALQIIMNSKPYKKKKFEYMVTWGDDLHSEHERYLVEKHFKKPVIVRDYPKSIKAFYMRENEGTEPDKKTVAAMDILFPGIGEVVGGSQREERLDKLVERMEEVGIEPAEMQWYLDLRKFGGCPHSGFGLGFERIVQYVTGMGNIRDVIPFPRAPKTAEF